MEALPCGGTWSDKKWTFTSVFQYLWPHFMLLCYCSEGHTAWCAERFVDLFLCRFLIVLGCLILAILTTFREHEKVSAHWLVILVRWLGFHLFCVENFLWGFVQSCSPFMSLSVALRLYTAWQGHIVYDLLQIFIIDVWCWRCTLWLHVWEYHSTKCLRCLLHHVRHISVCKVLWVWTDRLHNIPLHVLLSVVQGWPII